jgi:hypothetical protein
MTMSLIGKHHRIQLQGENHIELAKSEFPNRQVQQGVAQTLFPLQSALLILKIPKSLLQRKAFFSPWDGGAESCKHGVAYQTGAYFGRGFGGGFSRRGVPGGQSF